MISAIRSIFSGLFNFFRGVATVVSYVPKAFSAVWSFFGALKSILSVLPSGIAALALLALVCAVVYLVLGR